MHGRCYTPTGIASPFPHLWCFPTRTSHQALETARNHCLLQSGNMCTHGLCCRRLASQTDPPDFPVHLPNLPAHLSNLPAPSLLTPACAPAVLCNAEAPGVREHVLQQLALLGLGALVRKLDAVLNNSGDLGVKVKGGNQSQAAAHMQQRAGTTLPSPAPAPPAWCP